MNFTSSRFHEPNKQILYCTVWSIPYMSKSVWNNCFVCQAPMCACVCLCLASYILLENKQVEAFGIKHQIFQLPVFSLPTNIVLRFSHMQERKPKVAMSFRLHESFIYDAHFEHRKHFECKRNKAEHQEMRWCVFVCVCVRLCVCLWQARDRYYYAHFTIMMKSFTHCTSKHLTRCNNNRKYNKT